MDLNTCKQYGIDLSGYKKLADRASMTMDADLITTANTQIPAELLTYFDNKAIEILTQKRLVQIQLVNSVHWKTLVTHNLMATMLIMVNLM